MCAASGGGVRVFRGIVFEFVHKKFSQLVGLGFDAVFFEEGFDARIFILELKLRQITDQGWSDLVGELGTRFNLLLLGLKLLLEGLEGELLGLDRVLLFLKVSLKALVTPSGDEKPKA